MLTTGYDVARLKKLYLLRGPHAHSLLQTISRVNRPYKAPGGRNFINKINQDTSVKLYKHDIFDKVDKYYEPILNEMYSNL